MPATKNPIKPILNKNGTPDMSTFCFASFLNSASAFVLFFLASSFAIVSSLSKDGTSKFFPIVSLHFPDFFSNFLKPFSKSSEPVIM